MMEYVLSTGAEFDLDEIWECIAHGNIDAADRWVGKLFDAFAALARTPVWDTKGRTLLNIQCSSGR